jgi:hypothetical protein
MADEKAQVRAVVFSHLAGIVAAPVTKALSDRGVLDFFETPDTWVDLSQVVERTGGNRGYLQVALRILVGNGWLKRRNSASGNPTEYAATEAGLVAFRVAPPLYREAFSYYPMSVFLEDFLYGKSQGGVVLPTLQALLPRMEERWGLAPGKDPLEEKVLQQLRGQLDGILVGPAMVALARGGVFAKMQKGPIELKSIDANQSCLYCLMGILTAQGWVEREKHKVKLTSCGLYASQIAAAYGVTVSYIPQFTVLNTLLFGNARIPRFDESGVEVLVNRGMNVWGSGGAHKTYFKKVDEIIVEIFNRPIDQQPKGICDMGCGDGTLLEHLYSVVKTQTERGKVLDKHPLLIVGADFNKVARRITTQNLRKAGIPTFQVIHGDINRPAQLAGDLEKVGTDIHDLLHVRSFLDHNRPYLKPANYVPGSRPVMTSGAFAYLGEEIPADELEENLVRHLRRWAPYVGRHGLLVLELHTLPPELTAANLDKTPTVAYDGTHGFSDQFLVEVPVFLACAREAGLVADPRYQAMFPPSELATVSINYFTAPQA